MKKGLIILSVLVALSISIFALNHTNDVTADENLHHVILSEKFGINLSPVQGETKVSGHQARDIAYESFKNINNLDQASKDKAIIEHVNKSAAGAPDADVWAITFDNGKYHKEGMYPNAKYMVTVFVDSQTGETLGGIAYDKEKHKDLKNELNKQN